MIEVDNPMLRPSPAPDHHESPYQSPCRQTAPTFREFIEEEFTLNDILGDPMIMEILINKHHDRYLKWLEKIS